jgi:hypothetical protein
LENARAADLLKAVTNRRAVGTLVPEWARHGGGTNVCHVINIAIQCIWIEIRAAKMDQDPEFGVWSADEDVILDQQASVLFCVLSTDDLKLCSAIQINCVVVERIVIGAGMAAETEVVETDPDIVVNDVVPQLDIMR